MQNKKQPNKPKDIELKRAVLQRYLDKFLQSQPNLYYEPTSTIARNLHQTILEHKNRMPVEEQLMFKNLTVRDIEMILSFH